MRGAKNLRPTQKKKERKKEREKERKEKKARTKKNQINMTAISVEDWQENGLLF